ncbi:hypothetical protein IWQ57_003083 [Coemansia nantahalensis]|uniref:Uncharacterized protein n=1 Tax=Coemansia nantahalensis TaxID=2789366 RepID=A0ACC1JY33_9FUNG|nr:hypothetical protein IWQ57_003083 [Coemansia nantahalensis]
MERTETPESGSLHKGDAMAAPDDPTGSRLRWAFRKVDATLLVVLFVSTILNSMDRSNLGLSKVAGLEADTGMSGSDFNVVASLLYPTYLLFMLPSNLALRRFGARIWLSAITIVWGAINMCMAFAKNRTDLILCRLFLGAAESGGTPGALMLIALWYPRSMVTSRVALLYSAVAAGAVIGGPIASAIITIDNPRFPDWGWIFFIEGLVTVGFGLVMFVLLADYPEKSWQLNSKEKLLIRQRMGADQVEGGHRKVNTRRLLVHARDPLIYAQAMILFCANFGINTILTFGAIIIKQLGYTAGQSQALQAVPGLCGFVGILISRYYPRWFRSHYAGTLLCSAWLIGGSIILLATTNNGARIFALCMIAFGAFGNLALGPGWLMSNVGGPTRSALGSAINVIFGGIGGLCTSYIYRNKDAPRYMFGHGMNLMAGILSAMVATAAYAIVVARNRQKVREPRSVDHLTADEIMDLENDHPDFRYTA